MAPKGKTHQNKKGYYKKQYRSSAKDGGRCPLRTSGIGGRADYKKLEETTDQYWYDQRHQRLQTAYARKMKKLRQSTVEPVLGTLTNFMGVLEDMDKRKKQANKFMLGAATAYNLKKWLNHQPANRQTKINTIKKGCKAFILSFLSLHNCSVATTAIAKYFIYNK